MREHGRDVAGRVLAPLFHQRVDVRRRLGEKTEARLTRVAFERVVGILEAEVLVGDLQHPLLALARDAEHLGDHAQRLQRGQLAHEVELAPAAVARQLVEDLAGDLLESRLEPADRARCEPVRDEPAVVAVLGRVHVHEHAQRRGLLEPLPRPAAHLGKQDEAPRAAEALGLLRDLDDVGVLRDRPERLVARRRHPMDGRFAPQPAPGVVRVAVLAVGLRRDDVERVE